MRFINYLLWFITFVITLKEATTADDDYKLLHKDGSYEFGYNNGDSYHYVDANRNNVLKGQFGSKNPGTGTIDSTVYTAGPRGFRPRGKNIARKYDLNQNGPRAIGSRDDPYYDPYEDPSYSFSFRTRTYNRDENANRVGDVNGRYSYIDDVGERHNVEFIAGKKTGFHVKTPFPDSNPRSYGPLYFKGRGKPIPRGRTSIQRGLDGSYKFVSAGPDQRRSETSDSTGHVRGSYTYLDDKGVQHSVHYIAGPETGYRVLKQVKGPHLPTIFPFERPEIIPADFYDYEKDGDLFDTAASGHVKPGKGKPNFNDKDGSNSIENKNNINIGGSSKPRPSYTDEDNDEFGDLFDAFSTTRKPLLQFESAKDKSTTTRQPLPRPTSSEDNKSTTRKPHLQSTSSNYDKSTTNRPLSRPGSFEDDSVYKSSTDVSFYTTSSPTISTTTFRPKQNITKAGKVNDNSESSYTTTKPQGYFTLAKPTPSFEDGYKSNEVNDFSLFGSESNHPRKPYGPVITIGTADGSCSKCTGTIVTNVGDSVFSVAPGVSVRAHVQAIDLLPINPRVPSPSEQYNADVTLVTSQLNLEEDKIVTQNITHIKHVTTEATKTTMLTNNNSTAT